MRAVLDASVGVTLVHDESATDATTRWVTRWLAAGGRLAVPSLFWLEVANVLARRYRYGGEAVLEAVAELRQLEVETVDLDEAAVVLVIDVIERHAVTAYDAAYLALSIQLDVPLVTLDGRLARAADAAGGAIDPTARGGAAERVAPYGTATPTWPDYAGAARHLAAIRARVASDAHGSRAPLASAIGREPAARRVRGGVFAR